MEKIQFKFPAETIEIAESLLIENDQTENGYVAWLSNFTDSRNINSLLSFFENKQMLQIFARKTGLLIDSKIDPHSNTLNIDNFVKILLNFWSKYQIPDIFALFYPVIHKSVNSDFQFEFDFESFLYSNSQLVTLTIIQVTILTILGLRNEPILNVNYFFNEFSELKNFDQVWFEKELKKFHQLHLLITQSSQSQKKLVESIENTQNFNFSDVQSYKKIEELEKKFEQIQLELKESEAAKSSLLNQNIALEQQLNEKANEIRQLKFSKDDLLEKLKNKKFEFINEVVEEKNEEIKKIKLEFESIQNEHRMQIRNFEDEKDDLYKKIHLLENFRAEYESFKVQAEKNARIQKNEFGSKFNEEIQDLREKLTKTHDNHFAEKQKCQQLEMILQNLNMEVHNLKMDKQNLEFQVKEAENNQLSVVQSDLYISNIDEIIKDLSCSKEVEQINLLLARKSEQNTEKGHFLENQNSEKNDEHENEPISRHFIEEIQKDIHRKFNTYEKRCIARVKIIMKQFTDEEEKNEELEKEVELQKEAISDLSNKVEYLENKQIEKMLAVPAIQDIIKKFDSKSMEGGEVAQDLFKTILKREQEIARLKQNQRRFNNTVLGIEGRCLDNMSLIFSLIESYASIGEKVE